MPSDVTSPTWNSGKGKQRSENKAFVLFIYLKLPNKNKTAMRGRDLNKCQIPAYLGLNSCQMPGVCPGGMGTLGFDSYIRRTHSLRRTTDTLKYGTDILKILFILLKYFLMAMFDATLSAFTFANSLNYSINVFLSVVKILRFLGDRLYIQQMNTVYVLHETKSSQPVINLLHFLLFC